MHSRTKIAVAAAAAAALTVTGTAAALASTTSAKHGSHSQTVSVSAKKPGPSSERQGHDAMVAAVAGELHLSAARVSVALAPLFAAGRADPSSPVFAAAARSLGVSAQRLDAALVQAKQSAAGRG